MISCKEKDKRKEKPTMGPTCWCADMDDGGPWMRVDTGVRASGRIADGFADRLRMGLMWIEADGFDVDGLWMGLMRTRLQTGCSWV